MIKRLLDCNASDFIKMKKSDILESIAASEGRVLVSEIIGMYDPTLHSISNAELAAAFGADILLLNMFDVYNPTFHGIPNVEKQNVIKEIKKLTGRLIGVNLEPVDNEQAIIGEVTTISKGRLATNDTAMMAYELGADMIVLTGNPGTGVSNKGIISSLKGINSILGDKVILVAGKMHASGSLREAGENIITKADIREFVQAGANILM